VETQGGQQIEGAVDNTPNNLVGNIEYGRDSNRPLLRCPPDRGGAGPEDWLAKGSSSLKKSFDTTVSRCKYWFL